MYVEVSGAKIPGNSLIYLLDEPISFIVEKLGYLII